MRVGGSYVKSIINGAVKPSVFSTKSLNKYGLSSNSNFNKVRLRLRRRLNRNYIALALIGIILFFMIALLDT